MGDSPMFVERQIAGIIDSSALEVDDLVTESIKSSSSTSERVRSPWDCSICLHPPQNPVVTRCGHLFCRDDLLRWLPQSSSCPLCLQRLPPGLEAFTPIFCHPSSSHTPLPPSPEDELRQSRTRRRSSQNLSRPRAIPPNPYPFAPFASTPTPAFPSPGFPSVGFPSVAFPTVAFPSPPSFSMPASIGQFAYIPAVAMGTGSLNQFNAQTPLDLSQFNMKGFNFGAFPHPLQQYGFGQAHATPPPQTMTETDKHATRSVSRLLSVAALCVILAVLWSGKRDAFTVPDVRHNIPL